MIVVLVTSRYKAILDWIFDIKNENIKHIGIVKQIGPRVYLYVDTALSQDEAHHLFRQQIVSRGGMMYVYELYGIYNGMIDYNAYMSEQTKSATKYYQSIHKDITEQEIENYKQAHLG